MATPGKCVICRADFADVESLICLPCVEEAMRPWDTTEQEMAKSSTSVMQASVCQKCGCKLDGVAHGGKIGCVCGCHEGA